jgi:hypothetical protein
LKSLNIFSLALTSRTNELFQPILMFARKAWAYTSRLRAYSHTLD